MAFSKRLPNLLSLIIIKISYITLFHHAKPQRRKVLYISDFAPLREFFKLSVLMLEFNNSRLLYGNPDFKAVIGQSHTWKRTNYYLFYQQGVFVFERRVFLDQPFSLSVERGYSKDIITHAVTLLQVLL